MLLDVWREACRQLNLSESIVRLGELIRRTVPVDVVMVRRIALDEGVIETVALTVCGAAPIPRHARIDIQADDQARVEAWLREGAVIQSAARDRSPLLQVLAPKDVAGRLMAL